MISRSFSSHRPEHRDSRDNARNSSQCPLFTFSPDQSPTDFPSVSAVPNVPDEELEDLILNFLINEGHGETAVAFATETQRYLPTHSSSLSIRSSLRSWIISGDVHKAISFLTSYNPILLDSNIELRYSLHLQQVIEFCRQSDVNQAMSYCHEYILPFFLNQKKTNSLLIGFPKKSRKCYLI
ncbi:hypothetical protein GEMRC1_013502 [Eukaryota sp. GEM-RC1]